MSSLLCYISVSIEVIRRMAPSSWIQCPYRINLIDHLFLNLRRFFARFVIWAACHLILFGILLFSYDMSPIVTASLLVKHSARRILPQVISSLTYCWWLVSQPQPVLLGPGYNRPFDFLFIM